MSKPKATKRGPRSKEDLMLGLSEAAQQNTELLRMIERIRREKEEVQKSLELQQFRLAGFQLELEARHYELPFMKAQIEAIIQGANWPEPVRHMLTAMQGVIDDLVKFTNGNKPTLDPTTWVMLARKLGIATNFQTRRTPAKLVEAKSTEPTVETQS